MGLSDGCEPEPLEQPLVDEAPLEADEEEQPHSVEMASVVLVGLLKILPAPALPTAWLYATCGWPHKAFNLLLAGNKDIAPSPTPTAFVVVSAAVVAAVVKLLLINKLLILLPTLLFASKTLASTLRPNSPTT